MSYRVSDPRDRYSWLNRMYNFGEYLLAVYDEVVDDSYGCQQVGVSELEVYAASLTSDSILEQVQKSMLKHTLSQCTILNKDGEVLGKCEFRRTDGSSIDRVVEIHDPSSAQLWCSDLEYVQNAKYLSLDDKWSIRKVVVYELTVI
jgi:hypothetical protein